MLTFWSLVLVWNFGQNPQTDKPGESPPKATVPAKADEKTPSADKGAAPAGTVPAAAPAEPDSEHDKFVRKEAEKLDKVTSVSAELVFTSRNQDQLISQKGTYKLGPNNRLRMDLAFGEGPNSGKRTYICDGATSFTIEEFGEFKRAKQVKLDRIRPLLEDKNIPDELRNQFWGGIVPFQKPGAMLRSYLDTITFTERRDDKLGERDVVRLEGRWRKNAVAALNGGDATKTIDDVDPRVPRYMTLVLDKQTGWPLQMELFQRLANVGVMKPYLTMKFSKLAIGQTVPESEFKYTAPSSVQVVDETPMYESGLKRFIEQTAAQKAAGKAPEKAPPGEKTAPASTPTPAEPKKP
jgi:outer membrane lipoprotein-sorting protein